MGSLWIETAAADAAAHTEVKTACACCHHSAWPRCFLPGVWMHVQLIYASCLSRVSACVVYACSSASLGSPCNDQCSSSCGMHRAVGQLCWIALVSERSDQVCCKAPPTAAGTHTLESEQGHERMHSGAMSAQIISSRAINIWVTRQAMRRLATTGRTRSHSPRPATPVILRCLVDSIQALHPRAAVHRIAVGTSPTPSTCAWLLWTQP
jgi:hypothetical protein